MSNEKLFELEHRLALAEREVEKTRAEVRALRERERPRSRLRRDGVIALLGLVLVFTVTRALDTQAQSADPQVLTVKAPFKVVDSTGKRVIMQLKDFGPGILLTVGEIGSVAGGVEIGLDTSGNGLVNVFTKDGARVTGIGTSPRYGPGVFVFGPDGKTYLGRLAAGLSNKGELQIGGDSSARAHIGVGDSGAGMGVGVFGENGKELLTLVTDQKGGSVKVRNSAGVAVGGLMASATGGGLVLTGPNGGTSAVSLAGDATGGTVRVFRATGGNAQAELSAYNDGTGGGLTVYDTSGAQVALLRAIKERGRLEISQGRQVYVEAGILPTGVGVVRAGPQIGGATGGLGIPWAIIGKPVK